MIRRIAAVIAALVATGLIAWWLSTTDVISEQLAPILFTAIVFIRDFFSSLPQYFLWFFFVLIAARFVIVGLIRLYKAWAANRDDGGRPVAAVPAGAVERYSGWIMQSGMGSFFHRRVITQLSRVAMSVLYPDRHMSLLDIERALNKDDNGLPDHIIAYLRSAQDKSEEPSGLTGQVQQRIRRLSSSAEIDTSDLLATVSYLENHLGITPPAGTLDGES